jgi:hypothetical protein
MSHLVLAMHVRLSLGGQVGQQRSLHGVSCWHGVEVNVHLGGLGINIADIHSTFVVEQNRVAITTSIDAYVMLVLLLMTVSSVESGLLCGYAGVRLCCTCMLHVYVACVVCSVYVVCCMLYVVCCMLYVVCCMLYVVCLRRTCPWATKGSTTKWLRWPEHLPI